MAVTLDREQRRTAQAIRREARQRYAPGRERRRAINAGLQVGLVEDNLHNSASVRDNDSQNWRQERESGYGDEWARTGGSLNRRASVRRFFNEFDQFADPGERSFEIAAEVQRPAAQYRGRYRDVRGQANAIRRGLAGSDPGGPVRTAGRGGGGAAANAAFDPGVGLTLGQQPVPKEALVPSAGLAPPAHSAQPTLPEGYQQPAGAAPVPKPSLAQRVAAMPGLEEDFGGGPTTSDTRRAAAERRGRGGVRANTAEGLADEVSGWASEALGLPAGSRDRSPGENAAVGGAEDSDHLEGGAAYRGREGVDIPTSASAGGWGQYRKTVRRLGGKPDPGGFSQFQIKVGDKRFRVQVIFGDAHDHGDHIHVGFRRES